MSSENVLWSPLPSSPNAAAAFCWCPAAPRAAGPWDVPCPEHRALGNPCPGWATGQEFALYDTARQNRHQKLTKIITSVGVLGRAFRPLRYSHFPHQFSALGKGTQSPWRLYLAVTFSTVLLFLCSLALRVVELLH